MTDNEIIIETLEMLGTACKNASTNIKLLNDKGVSLTMRVKTNAGSTYHLQFVAGKAESNQSNIEIVNAEQKVNLIGNKKW